MARLSNRVSYLLLPLLLELLLLAASLEGACGYGRGRGPAGGREGSRRPTAAGGTVLWEGRKKRTAPVYVFGDSYVDTGNHDPQSTAASINKPWRTPYGSTWPGKPLGRYCDGRLFTDFYVSQLHQKLPTLYRTLNISSSESTQHERNGAMISSRLKARTKGISFAFGGSGVFPTSNLCPNVSEQIDQLRTTINLGIVTDEDISKSSVLFSINGNDYSAYTEKYPDNEGIEDFIPELVEQMRADLEELAEIGFKKFVVTNLPPLGCLPSSTYVNNYTSCVNSSNVLCAYHNSLLETQISELQEEFPEASFTIIDLYSAFDAIIQGATFSMEPCCEGSCGEVDDDGVAQYTVCSDPTATLFWDIDHPTTAGWVAITNYLFSSSKDIYQSFYSTS